MINFNQKKLTISFTKGKFFSISYQITLFAIIFSFFGSEFYQNFIAGLGILSLGILHGANDLKIIGKSDLKIKSGNSLNYLILYLVIVVLGITVFYFIPGIALLSFIIVSCYHFGEQHWDNRLKHQKGSYIFYFTYGAFIFFMLFTLKYEETSEVIFKITTLILPFSFFAISLTFFALSLIILFLIQLDSINTTGKELFLLGLLAILFLKGTLLFGFGLYFVVWHSFPSLRSQVKHIYQNLNKTSILEYLKSALLYWIIALVGLFGAYFFLKIPSDQYLPLFFSFLAAITFPHALVMGRMFSIPRND